MSTLEEMVTVQREEEQVTRLKSSPEGNKNGNCCSNLDYLHVSVYC